MTNQEIFDLIDRFERSSISGMKLSTQDFSLELNREGHVSSPGASAPSAADPATAACPAPSLPAITAPLVGAFYAAPAPDQAPFVRAGERVKKGQTVCLIEAMKMMSEIPAPCDCVIEEVLKADGDLAAFGEPLLRYRPC